MNGRGAWPKSGAGGTLNAAGTGPGPYYVAPADGVAAPGSHGWNGDVNERAVHGAVVVIQRALNRHLGGVDLAIDGRYGPATGAAVKRWQSHQDVTLGTGVDGIFGARSARALFLPMLTRLVGSDLAYIVCGIITNESAWDPGAVGYMDVEDLGLAQINGPSNPSLSERERLTPSVAFTNAAARLARAIEVFDGDVRTAVASYNLGIGGASAWKQDGSPDSWTPAGSDKPRDVKGYIDRIMTACEGL